MNIERFLFPHTVSVRSMVGGGGRGQTPGTARSVASETIDERTLVKNRDNQEVVSNTRVTVPLDAAVQAGDLVTVWPGTAMSREAQVIRVGRDQNDPPLPSHLILWLT